MDILQIFNPWDIAVLAAAMLGTRQFKPFMKKRGVNDWWIIFTPFIFAGIGLGLLAVAGECDIRWWPVKTFVFGAAGNYIFRLWKGARNGTVK